MEEIPAGEEEVAPVTCRLCEAPLPPGAERCPSCGMHQATQLSPSSLWRVGAGLAAVYLLTVLIVVLFR
jgi:ribosomal protein L40E